MIPQYAVSLEVCLVMYFTLPQHPSLILFDGWTGLTGNLSVTFRRLSDVLKRKRPPKRGPTRKGKGEDNGAEAGGKNTTPTSRSSLGRGKSACQ